MQENNDVKRQRIATDIASRAHSGQVRKSSGDPYVTHPISVSNMVRQFGYGRTAQIAALLHDVIEDAPDHTLPAFEEEIHLRFPAAYRIVKFLTHDKDTDYSAYVMSLPPEALQVKLTDMLHNMTDQPTQRQLKKYASALREIESLFGGNPPRINSRHWELLMNIIRDVPTD